MLGYRAFSPEWVVTAYWSAALSEDWAGAESLLLRHPRRITAGFGHFHRVRAIVNVTLSLEQGSAGVTYQMPVRVGQREFSIVRTAWLRLADGKWKIVRL